MSEYMDYIIAVLVFTGLAAGWAALQFLARKVGTKNHMDNAGGCGSCNCGGEEGACSNEG